MNVFVQYFCFALKLINISSASHLKSDKEIFSSISTVLNTQMNHLLQIMQHRRILMVMYLGLINLISHQI